MDPYTRYLSVKDKIDYIEIIDNRKPSIFDPSAKFLPIENGSQFFSAGDKIAIEDITVLNSAVDRGVANLTISDILAIRDYRNEVVAIVPDDSFHVFNSIFSEEQLLETLFSTIRINSQTVAMPKGAYGSYGHTPQLQYRIHYKD